MVKNRESNGENQEPLHECHLHLHIRLKAQASRNNLRRKKVIRYHHGGNPVEWNTLLIEVIGVRIQDLLGVNNLLESDTDKTGLSLKNEGEVIIIYLTESMWRLNVVLAR